MASNSTLSVQLRQKMLKDSESLDEQFSRSKRERAGENAAAPARGSDEFGTVNF
jgi:hypothetical protein